MFRMLISVVLAWSLSLGLAPAGQAASYYVATTGNDSQPGTQLAPFRTTVKAAQVARPGDTVFVRAGDWPALSTDTHTFAAGTSWEPSATIRWAGFPGETVKVRGLALKKAEVQYLVFDNFHFDGAWSVNEAVYIRYAHHIRVQHSHVRHGKNQGILLPPYGPGGNAFVDLDIYNNGTKDHLHHGVYISTANNLLEYSRIYANRAYGIHIYHNAELAGTPPMANGNVVRYNSCYGNGTGATHEGCVIVGSGIRNKVYNNQIYDNDGHGVQVSYNAKEQEIYNNTISGNAGYGIYLFSSSTDAVVHDNLVPDNASGAVRDDGVRTTLTNNVESGDTCIVAPAL